MNKTDLIVIVAIVAVYLLCVIFGGKSGALSGLIMFVAGALALWYYFMRKGVLG